MTEYISIVEAARRLGVSRSNVYKWIARHGFPVERIADHPVVSVKAMNRWFEKWQASKKEGRRNDAQ